MFFGKKWKSFEFSNEKTRVTQRQGSARYYQVLAAARKPAYTLHLNCFKKQTLQTSEFVDVELPLPPSIEFIFNSNLTLRPTYSWLIWVESIIPIQSDCHLLDSHLAPLRIGKKSGKNSWSPQVLEPFSMSSSTNMPLSTGTAVALKSSVVFVLPVLEESNRQQDLRIRKILWSDDKMWWQDLQCSSSCGVSKVYCYG